MKKILMILLLFLFYAVSLHAQGKLKIYGTDGNILFFDTDSISTITFTKETPPEYEVMSIYYRGFIPNPFTIGPDSLIDSITFEKDTMSTHSRTQGLQRLPFKKYIDSLTFTSFQTDTNIIELSTWNKYYDCRLHRDDYGLYRSAVW